MPVPDTPWTRSKALCHSSTLGYTQWTWSRAFADLVQPLFGRGAISPLGPGPATMPHKYPRATLGGPGPPHKITPRPNIGHTKAKNQPHLGQIPPGPGQRLYAIQVRCKYVGLYTVDLVQGLRGPGPATFWTWCHFTPWTWSSHHAPQVPQSHTRWTWSTTQNHTAAKYRPHQGQKSATPRPNSPWTWSKAFVDQVHHP